MIKCTWCEEGFEGQYKMEVYGGHTTGNVIGKCCWKTYESYLVENNMTDDLEVFENQEVMGVEK